MRTRNGFKVIHSITTHKSPHKPVEIDAVTWISNLIKSTEFRRSSVVLLMPKKRYQHICIRCFSSWFSTIKIMFKNHEVNLTQITKQCELVKGHLFLQPGATRRPSAALLINFCWLRSIEYPILHTYNNKKTKDNRFPCTYTIQMIRTKWKLLPGRHGDTRMKYYL